MGMTHEEFVERVARLEAFAEREPSRYALRVGLLAALGYAYVFMVLGVVLLLFGGIIYLSITSGRFNYWALKFGWILLMLAVVVARALYVRVAPPGGIELKREGAPRLFGLVDELTRALQSPPVHKVLVDDDYNAALAQVPRLGLLGWHRNYLVLGLPLMQALTPEQFRAVLAHEMGHLSGNHGRFGGWIYRVRLTWYQLLVRLEAEGRWGSGIFVKFFNWYAPYFNAYSFVLARRHEYEADGAAARIAGARTMADALVSVDLKGSYLSEKFWPEVFKHAETQAEPARGAFARMAAVLGGPVPLPEASRFLRRSLAQQTGYDDTHPSLAARLAALGFDSAPREGTAEEWARRQQSPAAGESAAAHFLGEQLSRALTERLEEGWASVVSGSWRQRHEEVKAGRKKLAELNEKATAGELKIEEAWERAYWTLEFEGGDAAIPLLREIVEREPRHARASFALGSLLLERGEEEGIAHVERAMEAEPDSAAQGCQMIQAYLRERGREEEAEKYRRRLLRHLDVLQSAGDERAAFRDGEEIAPHEMPAEQVERLRRQLAGLGDVAAAYLARKRLEHFPDKPLYVLGVETKKRWYRYRSASADSDLLHRLVTRLEIPGESFVVILDRNFSKTKKAMRQLEGALIFEQ